MCVGKKTNTGNASANDVRQRLALNGIGLADVPALAFRQLKFITKV